MGEFSEHVKILVLAILFFSSVFVVSYSKNYERLWLSVFVVLIILFASLAVLARWSQVEIEQTD